MTHLEIESFGVAEGDCLHVERAHVGFTLWLSRGPGKSAAQYSHFWMLRKVQRGYACFDAYARISLTVSAQQMMLALWPQLEKRCLMYTHELFYAQCASFFSTLACG